MTHSVYTLCGFQKHNPVGFCVFCEIYGNYIQRNHKYNRGGRLNIIRSLHDKILYVHYTNQNYTFITRTIYYTSILDEPFVIYNFVQIYMQKGAYSPYINVKAGKKGGY